MANGRCYVSPLDYGLSEAKNGREAYYVLLKCHQDAIKNKKGVSYKGIKILNLEIPQNAITIPLTYYTDFAGAKIVVKNTQKNFSLFRITQGLKPIETIKGQDIDNGNFSDYQILRKGKKLLVIEDDNPWVENRKGYSYGAIRKDVMLVRNGKATNSPIALYNTPFSRPKGSYCDIVCDKISFKNMIFVRTSESTHKTELVEIQNQYNVEISNVSIITPRNDKLYGDAIIRVVNCVDVTLKDVTIQGTYSQVDKYGYGVFLNNIYNLKVEKMYARAQWGVFGTNNINYVTLKECNINRFDIHCYGRDIKSLNCKFSGMYNQFSSVYGIVYFKGCTFTDFTPVLMEPSYNAYTPFDIVWEECTFNLTRKHSFFFTFSGLTNEDNSRHELMRKCMPNFYVRDCKVYLADDINKWYLIRTGVVNYMGELDYASEIIMKNVKVYGNAAFELSTKNLKTSNDLIINIDLRK